MLKIFTNVVTKKNFDENGNLFENGQPRMFFKSKETVVWQLCADTPELNETQTPEADWPKYTGYSAYTGVGAYLTADADYRLKRQGTLVSAVEAGSVSSVEATVEGASYAMIPETGVITLFTSTGTMETLSYTERSVNATNGRVTFTIAEGSTVANSYPQNSEMDCVEAFYMQAAMDGTLSNPSEGMFGFEITAFSEKLRRSIVYSDVKELSISGLELAVCQISGTDSTVQDLERYMVETFAIRSGIADVSLDVPVTTAQESAIAATINALLASGFELQFSADGSNWHTTQAASTDNYYRFRLAGGGGNWSTPVQIIKGADGQDGQDGQDGETPVLQIGTVVTLAAGASATASISGTAPNFSLNLGIPRGSDGQGGSGTVTWGGISGTLSSQTDLNNALAAKQNVINASNKLDYGFISSTPTIGSGTLTITSGGVSTTFNANQTSNASVTIPSVGSGNLTISSGGSTWTFNANATSNTTIDLGSGGGGSSTETFVYGTTASFTLNGASNAPRANGTYRWDSTNGRYNNVSNLGVYLQNSDDDPFFYYNIFDGSNVIYYVQNSGSYPNIDGTHLWTVENESYSDYLTLVAGDVSRPTPSVVYDLGSSSGSVWVSYANGDYQKLTLTGNTEIAVMLQDRPPIGCGMLVEVTNSGYAVSVGASTLVSSGTSGKYLVGLFNNGGGLMVCKGAPEIYGY